MSEDMNDYVGLGELARRYALAQAQAQQAAVPPVSIQAWRRERSARFGQVDVHVCCSEDGALQSLRIGGQLWAQDELRPLVGFLQELLNGR